MEEENNHLPHPSSAMTRHPVVGSWGAPLRSRPWCESVLPATADRAPGQVGPIRAGVFQLSEERKGPGSPRTGQSGAAVTPTLGLVEAVLWDEIMEKAWKEKQ